MRPIDFLGSIEVIRQHIEAIPRRSCLGAFAVELNDIADVLLGQKPAQLGEIIDPPFSKTDPFVLLSKRWR